MMPPVSLPLNGHTQSALAAATVKVAQATPTAVLKINPRAVRRIFRISVTGLFCGILRGWPADAKKTRAQGLRFAASVAILHLTGARGRGTVERNRLCQSCPR